MQTLELDTVAMLLLL